MELVLLVTVCLSITVSISPLSCQNKSPCFEAKATNLFQRWDEMFTKIWLQSEAATDHNNFSISHLVRWTFRRDDALYFYTASLFSVYMCFLLGLETLFSCEYLKNSKGFCNCIPLKCAEENHYKLEQGHLFKDWTFELRILKFITSSKKC